MIDALKQLLILVIQISLYAFVRALFFHSTPQKVSWRYFINCCSWVVYGGVIAISVDGYS